MAFEARNLPTCRRYHAVPLLLRDVEALGGLERDGHRGASDRDLPRLPLARSLWPLAAAEIVDEAAALVASSATAMPCLIANATYPSNGSSLAVE